MIFDDDDFFAILQQRNNEPLPEDEDSMHEAIEQYLRKRTSISLRSTAPARGRFKLCRPAKLAARPSLAEVAPSGGLADDCCRVETNRAGS